MNAVRRSAARLLATPRHVAVRLLASDAASHGHGHGHGHAASHGHEEVYGGHDPHKSLAETLKEHRATLNDLPVPAGSWDEYHKKRNTGYNLVLALGVVSVVSTYFMMKASGAWYFHGPPNYKKLQINID